jgi:hypothetical protein
MKKIFALGLIASMITAIALINSSFFAQSPVLGFAAFMLLVFAALFFHSIIHPNTSNN